VTHSQRLPTAQERFANGPHGGTWAYDIGTSELDQETSTGFDLTLANEEARLSTSFLKDRARLPGRNLLFGLRARF
jgi:iron complex outermembrane receptor protein